MKSIAQAQKVPVKSVSVNATSLQQNMVVKIHQHYYQVVFDNNFTSYQLKKAQVINPKITYQQ
ncbi:hypothetical protein FC71_GL000257 [Latilactobacillus sakei subsp. carnosus DSM 15831]|nr:DUF3290 family protein [Latilactobacillus sakei]KRL71944.1 hypothetical protein FC71_GL000257 [Latilactobacillus sakei subsp. carnosus DSM 15831]GEP21835.1 hypothetical protein LSA03nite_14230 [Latilactobacillus sakei subsp. carnosus]